ncbi:AraC family transcriptional regulator [Vallitaleaceae bacterium 9-2]
MVTNERLLYTTNLLSETLPDEFMNERQLLSIGIDPHHQFLILQLILGNTLKSHINSLNPDSANEWKSQLHQIMVKHFAPHVLCFLNLQPFTRTVVLSIDPSQSLSQVKAEFGQRFIALSNELHSVYQYDITGCFGSIVSNYFQIGSSYKKARLLQEYHFIIGLGHCIFFDDPRHTDEYSLVEYKYVHHFESLFEDKQWIQMLELLNTIKHALVQNMVNDSKVTYIYKEIFSITIRQLFDQLDDYKQEIEKLNTGIIMFDHLFDDIEQVNQYYLEVMHRITKQVPSEHMHLHIKKALNLIHQHYMEDISLIYLADALNISTAYLSRLFKQEVDMNFKEYLTRYRISKAKDLLDKGSLAIKDIAYHVGYSSPTQFARVFKQVEGIKPSQYRQVLKNKGNDPFL